MDDPMFSGIHGGLRLQQQMGSQATMGPQGANLIAEPAQLVVLVPGTKSGEQLLSKVKAYVIMLGMGLLGLFALFGVYSWKRKGRKVDADYAGSMLPGASMVKQAVMAPTLAIAPAAKTVSVPTVSVPTVHEDVVRVTGPLPVWDLTDATEPEEEDKRVTENDPTIQAIIKSREALSKEIEAFQISSSSTT